MPPGITASARRRSCESLGVDSVIVHLRFDHDRGSVAAPRPSAATASCRCRGGDGIRLGVGFKYAQGCRAARHQRGGRGCEPQGLTPGSAAQGGGDESGAEAVTAAGGVDNAVDFDRWNDSQAARLIQGECAVRAVLDHDGAGAARGRSLSPVTKRASTALGMNTSMYGSSRRSSAALLGPGAIKSQVIKAPRALAGARNSAAWPSRLRAPTPA